MKFLEDTLHIKVREGSQAMAYGLPKYMTNRYTIEEVYLDGQKVFFLQPKTELEAVHTLNQHIQKLQTVENIPVVLSLARVTAQERQALITAAIPFVVENKQCYLPFMGTYLTERNAAPKFQVKKLLPAAQLLLFYYIYQGQEKLYSQELIKALQVSGMTVTRAIRQLEGVGLLQTYKEGVQKVVTSSYQRRELFEKAQPYLINPVKKTAYLPKRLVDANMVAAGELALAEYTLLNQPAVECYALTSFMPWKEQLQEQLFNPQEQVQVELWKYNPLVLAGDNKVDVLSLAMSCKDSYDERIEEAVEEMLEQFWEDAE